jgi:hypothetical protein
VSLKSSIFVAAALAFGCSLLGSSGPTKVAQGEYYSAGRPEFDSFFIELYQLQVELLDAPNEPRDARRNLTKTVSLTAEASDESLSKALSDEAKKLAAQGLRLRLDVPAPTPEPGASVTLHASDGGTSPLRSSLSIEATRVVRSRSRMLAVTAQMQELSVKCLGLEGKVEPAFRTEGPWKRGDVRRNLADGQKLISVMQARAKDVAASDEKLLSLLAAALTTDANLGKTPSPSAAPEPDPNAKPKPSRRTPSANPAPPRPGNAKLAATPRPAAAPKPTRANDEDAPPPKPTQGSAPAEIEP